MSCQQVPRITEDPYVFTETVPSAPLFNPPFRKITSFISNPIPANEIQKSKPVLHKQKISQTRLISQSQQQTTLPVTPPIQFISNRINGSSTTNGGGVPKNVIGLSTISNGIRTHVQPQVHIQQQQQQLPKLIQSRKVITTPHLVAWSTTASSQQESAVPPAPSAPAPVPLLFPASNNPTIVTTSNVVSSSPLLPPSNFHKNTLSQHMQNFLPHSTGPIPAYVVQSQPQPRQLQKPTATAAATTTTTATNHSNDINEIPVNVIFRNPHPTTVSGAAAQVQTPKPASAPAPAAVMKQTTTTPIVNKKFVPSPIASLTKSDTTTKLPTSGKQAKESKKRKTIFPAPPPAKRDSRVLSSSNSNANSKGHHTTTNATAAVTNKKLTKSQSDAKSGGRAYSQTAHHEALQRILDIAKSVSTTSNRKWHAPGAFMFDTVSPFDLNSPLAFCDNIEPLRTFGRSHWLNVDSGVVTLPSTANISREQRIELKKAQLRRQALQLIREQEFRTPLNARRGLVFVSKVLQKLKYPEDSPLEKMCTIPSCANPALTATTFCYMHITQSDYQHLFLSCTAKFSNNSQCQIPVFDISHDLPLCRLHAWKHDNYDRIVQDQKQPKKAPRKRTKPSAMTRPQKRSKKKRKTLSMSSANSVADSTSDYSQNVPVTLAPPTATMIIESPTIGGIPASDSIMMGYDVKLNGTIHHYPLQLQQQQQSYLNAVHHHRASITAPYTILPMDNAVLKQDLLTQEILGICENSSQYESSEDTGVGGLSETELMGGGAHDVIEEIPLGGNELLDTDFSNVFYQLPDDAINSLFNAVQQEEQEEVARALELANRQVKSLEQLTADDTSFLGDLLGDCVDDQILDDTDICSEVVLHSPDTSGIDTSTLFIDGGSNSTGSCSTTPSELRGLVQT